MMSIRGELIVVEDDRSWRDRLESQLQPVGIGIVQWLSNPTEAIRFIKSIEGTLPPFVVDISLRLGDPTDRSGLRVLEAIRERDSVTPVILVTAFVDENPGARGIASSYPATVFASKEDLERNMAHEIPRLIDVAQGHPGVILTSGQLALLRTVGIGSLSSIAAAIVFLNLTSLSALFMTLALAFGFALCFWVWEVTRISVLPPILSLFGVLGSLLLALTALVTLLVR